MDSLLDVAAAGADVAGAAVGLAGWVVGAEVKVAAAICVGTLVARAACVGAEVEVAAAICVGTLVARAAWVGAEVGATVIAGALVGGAVPPEHDTTSNAPSNMVTSNEHLQIIRIPRRDNFAFLTHLSLGRSIAFPSWE